MSRNAMFNQVESLHPRRNAFDLSYNKRFSCAAGELIPVLCEECVPGDTWHLSGEVVVRTTPPIVPLYHEVYAQVHAFFVPYRLLWSEWEEFRTGGASGTNSSVLPRYYPDREFHGGDPLPGDGVNPNRHPGSWPGWGSAGGNPLYTLWDYFGFPIGEGAWSGIQQGNTIDPTLPLAFPWRAYACIWNEYYRDQNFQYVLSADYTGYGTVDPTIDDKPNYDLLSGQSVPGSIYDLVFPMVRNYNKDYFTSALFDLQRGIAPGMPIDGLLPVQFQNLTAPNPGSTGSVPLTNADPFGVVQPFVTGQTFPYNATLPSSTTASWAPALGSGAGAAVNNPGQASMVVGPASVNVGSAVTFDINYLRTAVQLQKYLERNMRSGVRYTEWIKAHFGRHPRDERLQRPEYIGSFRVPINFTEVVQTSSTDTTSPQGNMAGHGLCAASGKLGSYKVYEDGIIMALLSIMPQTSYEDGVNRQWLRHTPQDFYVPEFAHLSEQAIYNSEVYATFDGSDLSPWGFQGRYDEMRVKYDMDVSNMRVNVPVSSDSISFWHLGRAFSSLPNLGTNFIQVEDQRRVFAFDNSAVLNVPPYIVNYYNDITAVRPLPHNPVPGLMDHF